VEEGIFMKKWTMTDVLLLFLANLLAIFVTRVLLTCVGMFLPSNNFYPGALTLFSVPLVFSAAAGFYLKKQGKKLRPYALTLVGLELLHIVLSQNLSFTTRIVKLFTGHYNLESTGFSLLFAIIYCAGLLAGCGLGHSLYQKKPN